MMHTNEESLNKLLAPLNLAEVDSNANGDDTLRI
jgi:hypothetical protein